MDIEKMLLVEHGNADGLKERTKHYIPTAHEKALVMNKRTGFQFLSPERYDLVTPNPGEDKQSKKQTGNFAKAMSQTRTLKDCASLL